MRATILEHVEEGAERSPDTVAVTAYERSRPVASLTRRELRDAVRRVGSALRGRIQPGDRVLLPFPQGIDVLVSFLGTLAAGGVAVPTEAPGRSTSLERFARLVEDADPTLILTTSAMVEQIQRRLQSRNVTLLTRNEIETAAPSGSFPASSVVAAGDLAFLQYTSGSTSAPRGVKITHENLTANLAMIHECFRARNREVVVSWLPFFHDMGLVGMMLFALRYSYPLHLLGPLDFMKNPAWWLQVISEARGTITAAPNFAYDHCVRRLTPEQATRLDLASLRVLVNGAEPVRADTMDRFDRHFRTSGFDPASWTPSYGLAEATLVVSSGPAPSSRPRASRNGRVLVGNGRTPAGVDVRFLVNDRVLARENVAGEILVHSASVSPGYWNSPEEPGLLADGKRFLRTGDLGFMREGEIFVTGRVKDLIIVHGRNFHPGDIEEVCREALPPGHDEMIAAVGIDRGDEEHIAVFLEVSREDAADRARFEDLAARVRSACTLRLQAPVREVVFVASRRLPRTTSGKIRRGAVREMHEAGQIPILERLMTSPPKSSLPPPRRRALPFPALMGRLTRLVTHALRRPGEPPLAHDEAEFEKFPGLLKQIRDRWRRWDHMRRQVGLTVPRPRRTFLRHAICSPPIPGIERQRRWRLVDDTLEDIATWTDFTGLEPLRRYRDAGEPVVLVASHFGACFVTPVLLARHGFRIASVGIPQMNDRDFSNVPNLTPVSAPSTNTARTAVECRRALARGEMVHIYADGEQGKRDVQVPFLTRERGFASGFASLAVAAGARAIPLFSLVDLRGRVRFEVGEPLDGSDASVVPRERVEKMVRAYARILERYWRRFPSHPNYVQLRTLVFPREVQEEQTRSRPWSPPGRYSMTGLDHGDALLAWIRANLLEESEKDRVTKDTDLIETGILDSLKIAELVFFLETELDLVIDTAEVEPENFQCVNRIVELIDRVKPKPA